MGQAKRRGTFEERKALSVERHRIAYQAHLKVVAERERMAAEARRQIEEEKRRKRVEAGLPEYEEPSSWDREPGFGALGVAMAAVMAGGLMGVPRRRRHYGWYPAH